jgi:hypothetical protein
MMKKFFETQAAHHEAISKAHGVMKAACDKDSADHEFHKTLEAEHAARATACRGYAADCDAAEKAAAAKAVGDANERDRFSAPLAPTAVSKIVAVPRAGQPTPVDPQDSLLYRLLHHSAPRSDV